MENDVCSELWFHESIANDVACVLAFLFRFSLLDFSVQLVISDFYLFFSSFTTASPHLPQYLPLPTKVDSPSTTKSNVIIMWLVKKNLDPNLRRKTNIIVYMFSDMICVSTTEFDSVRLTLTHYTLWWSCVSL
jgi:hypothetical protein